MPDLKGFNLAKNKGTKVFILIFTLAIMVTFTAKRALSEGNPIVNITYGGETWDGQEEFNNKWFSNSKGDEATSKSGEIIFEVDLSGKYEEGFDASQIPFNVEVISGANKESGKLIDNNLITISDKDGKGKYDVNVKLPEDKEESLLINIKVEDGNSWGIGAFEKNFEIIRDLTAPIVTLTGVEANKEYNSDVNTVFSVEEKNFNYNNVNLIIKKNNEVITPITWSNTADISELNWTPIDDGSYEIHLESTDKAGNKSEVIDVAFEVEKDGEVSISSATGNGETLANWYKSDVNLNVKLDRTKGSSVFYKKNGLDEETQVPLVNNIFTTNIVEEGNYEVFARATIKGSPVTISVGKFIIDKELPVVTATLDDEAFTNGSVFEIDKKLNLLISDKNLDKDNTIYSITKNGADFTEYDVTGEDGEIFIEGNLTEGNYVIEVTAVDLAGNNNLEATRSFSFTIDTKAPTLTSNINEGIHYYKEDQQLEVNVSDVTLSFEETIANVKINDNEESIKPEVAGVNNKYTVTLNATDDTEKAYNISSYVKDYFNREAELKDITVVIDKKAPVITSTEELNGDYATKKTLTLNITDEYLKDAEVTIKTLDIEDEVIDSESGELTGDDKTKTFSKEFDDGNYSVEVNAIDSSGNETTKTYRFMVATKPSNISVEGVADNSHNQGNPEIKITVKDVRKKSDITVKVGKDGQSLKEVDLSRIWKKTSDRKGYEATYKVGSKDVDGSYVLEVTAKSRADQGTVTLTKTFVIDNKAPEINISDVNSIITTEDLVESLEVSVEEKNFTENTVIVESIKDDKEPVVLEFNSTEAISKLSKDVMRSEFAEAGNYKLHVTATDKAGNSSTKSTSFIIDNSFEEVSVKKDGLGVVNQEVFNSNIENYNGEVVILMKDTNINLKESIIKVTKNGESYSSFEVKEDNTSKSITKDFEEGNYKVEIHGQDNAGNIKDYNVQFTVDGSKPDVKIERYTGEDSLEPVVGTIEEPEYFDEDQKIKVSVEETTLSFDKSKVDFTVKSRIKNFSNSLLAGTASEPITFVTAEEIFDKDGKYEISIDALDQLGNSIIVTKGIVVDKTDPTINVEEGSLEGIYSTDKKPVINITDTNLSKAEVIITKNGQKLEAIKLDITEVEDTEEVEGYKTATFNGANSAEKDVYVFTEGKYNVKIIAEDNAERSSSSEYEFIVDTSAPQLSIEGVGNVSEGDGYPHYKEGKDIKLTIADTTLNFDNIDGAPNTVLTITRKNKAGKVLEEKVIDTEEGWKEVIGEEPYEDAKGWKDGDEAATLIVPVSEPGYYTVTLISKDRAGYKNSITRLFAIDNTKPVITISGITNADEGSDMHFVQTSDKTSNLTINVVEENFERNNVTISILKDGEAFDLPAELVWDNKTASENHTVSFWNFKDGVYEVKVNAIDDAGNEAETKTIKFTVDNKASVISFGGVDLESFNNVDKELKVNVNELNYSNNKVTLTATRDGREYADISWANETDNKAVDSSITHLFNKDGYYVVKVNTVDKAGNKAEGSYSFTIDKTKPGLNISGFNGGIVDGSGYYHYKTSQGLTISVVDNNLSVNNEGDVRPSFNIYEITSEGRKDVTSKIVGENYWTFDKTNETDVDDKIALSFEVNSIDEQGTYEMDLSYVDKAGNEEKYGTVKFVIDSIKPIITLSGIGENSFNNTNKTLKVDVNELNFSTNNVSIIATRNGEAYNFGSWSNNGVISSLSHEFSQDGLYVVTVTSTDKAGNVADSKTITFTIDKTNPAITIEGVEEGEHYNIDKPLSINIVDNNHDVNTISVTKTGASYNAGSFAISGINASLSHNFSQEGDYIVTVKSVDKAGNEFTSTRRFTIDKTAPVITPTFSGQSRVIKDGEFINEIFTPHFVLDKSEDTLTSVTLNGKEVNGAVPISAADGKYSYKAKAKDKAGNESEITISYTLDLTIPEVKITGILDGFFNKDMAPVYSISDTNLDKSKTSVKLNGKNFISGTEIEEEGYYNLKAVATDLANNVTSRTIVFTLDKTAPKFKYIEKISGKYFLESIIPEILIEDMTEYTIVTQTLNGSPYKIGDEIKEDGKYVLFLEVKDKAGNLSNITVEFVIDQTKPKFIINGVKDGDKYNETVEVSILLDNPFDTIKKILVNGELVEGRVVEENGQKVVKLTLSDINDYDMELVAVDEAGNETIETLSFKIVEKTLFVKLYENKPVFYSTIVIFIAMLIGIAIYVLKRKEQDEEEENEE